METSKAQQQGEAHGAVRPDGRAGIVTAAQVALWLGAAALASCLLAAAGWVTGIGLVVTGALLLAAVLAVLAWAASVGVVVVALIGWGRPTRRPSSRRAILLASPGAVAGSVAVVLIAVSSVQNFGLFRANAAEERAEIAMEVYRDAGAELVCDNGSSGYGLVNRQPWYDAYLEVPVGTATQESAERALSAVGFETAERTDVGTFTGEVAPNGSFAMVAGTDTSNAAVATYQPGEVAFRCDGPDYGEGRMPAEGRTFVVVSVRLPEVR